MDAPEALREFLAYVVANLIDHPQQASISISHSPVGTVNYRVQLAPEDVRHVIGKNGLTISSIRSLMNTAAEKHGLKISLKVGVGQDESECEDSVEQQLQREDTSPA
jgi:predicted RNA-binding protein YlqC (UPF0109 family)